MKLLHIDSSILGGNSVSRTLSQEVVDRLTHETGDVELTYRDLAAEPIPHLSGEYLVGQSAEVQHDQALQENLALGGRVLDEFLSADTVVIGVAFYNFGVPSQLKAWIDRIAVSGKTFRYTESGSVGLAGDKRVILAIARGGIYSPGTPAASAEHAETYLKALFGFLGIERPEVIVAEGVAMGPDHRQSAIDAAKREIADLAA
jgi:FMN-dependent NADH-azoreductase